MNITRCSVEEHTHESLILHHSKTNAINCEKNVVLKQKYGFLYSGAIIS